AIVSVIGDEEAGPRRPPVSLQDHTAGRVHNEEDVSMAIVRRPVLTLMVAALLLGGALAPTAHAAGAHLQWTPASHALGALIVPPGQTATQSVSFVSNVVLTDAQVALTLDDAVQQRGVSISSLSTSLPAGGA